MPGSSLRAVRVVVVAALACLALVALPPSTPPAAATTTPIYGVDTSHYQHPNDAPIDWAKVKAAGKSFAIIKAVQGSTYTDPWFARDWVAVANAGLVRGAYDFAAPTASTASAVAEADHYAAVVGPMLARGILPPVLDIETYNDAVTGTKLTPTQLLAWIGAWIAEIKKKTGRSPMIYTGAWYWTGYVGNSTQYSQYPLWLSRWSSNVGTIPGGWPTYTVWQYSSTGTVSGISSQVDLDRFDAGATAFSTLANGASKLTTAPFGTATLTRTPAGISVDGWAIDPDTVSPITVTVAGAGSTVSVTADLASPASATAYPWYGSSHGFHVVLPAVAGPTTVTVTGTNVGAGADAVVASIPTTVLVAPQGSATIVQTPGGATASGWVVDPDSASSVTVHMTVDDVAVATTTASDPSSAAATAWPGYGDAHGFTLPADVPVGTHQVCLTADNLGVGSGSTSMACMPVTRYDHPLGSVTSTTLSPGGYTLSGTAFDDSSASPVQVHATVDGTPVVDGTADLAVATWPSALAAFGTAHGWRLTVPVTPGAHQLCVVADPVSTGTPATLSCQTTGRPAGPVLTSTAASVRTARVALAGWAIDPDTADPTTVRLTVDGVVVASSLANRSTPVPPTTYAAWGTSHGYSVSGYSRSGTHTVCVRATDPVTAVTTVGGCRRLTVSGNPFGSVKYGTASRTLAVSGYAVDPSTTAPIYVRVRLGTHQWTWRASAISGTPNLGPLLGTRHGYARTFTGLPHGRYTLTVTFLNVGDGSSVTALSRTVSL